MSDKQELGSDPEARDLNGVTLWEGLQALETHERNEGRICNANLLRRAQDSLEYFTSMHSVDLNDLYRRVRRLEEKVLP